MPRITKVYTRTGDDGTTALGGGQRVSKSHIRIDAFGEVDELNSCIGVAMASDLDPQLIVQLKQIQNDLFHLGSDLCILEADKAKFNVPQIEQRHIDQLEQWLDRLSESLEPLQNFILPGGVMGAAQLHLARTICRRAERQLVSLKKEEAIGHFTVQYLNRLSDLLFVMARYQNKVSGNEDVLWNSRA